MPQNSLLFEAWRFVSVFECVEVSRNRCSRSSSGLVKMSRSSWHGRGLVGGGAGFLGGRQRVPREAAVGLPPCHPPARRPQAPDSRPGSASAHLLPARLDCLDALCFVLCSPEHSGEEVTLLKRERDQLEKSVVSLTKQLTRLKEAASPVSTVLSHKYKLTFFIWSTSPNLQFTALKIGSICTRIL